MASTVQNLLDELDPKLEGHSRYTTQLKLDALNRGREQLILYASTNDDVEEASPIVDPDDSSKYLNEMPLPDRLLRLTSVSFDGIALRRLTQAEFVNAQGENLDTTGPPFYGFYVRSNRFLNFLPRPGENKTIQIYGVFNPPDMVSTDLTADIEVDRAYNQAIISYALYWLKRGITGEDKSANQHKVDYYQERADAKFNMTQNDVQRIQRKGYQYG